MSENEGSTGERIFSSKDAKITKREFPLRPDGNRWFKVLGDTAQIGTTPWTGLPDVSVQLESLDENAPKGRNFHNFSLDTRPDAKSGEVVAMGETGIFAFAQVLGRELQCHIKQVTVAKPSGETEIVDVYSPEDVKAFLLSVDGLQIQAREYIKKPSDEQKAKDPNAKPRNRIGRWIFPEAPEGAEGASNVETPPVDGATGEAPPPPRRGPPPPRRTAAERKAAE